MLLDYKNKFNANTNERFVPKTKEGKALEIPVPGFQKWTNVNMYRTSYHDMS